MHQCIQDAETASVESTSDKPRHVRYDDGSWQLIVDIDRTSPTRKRVHSLLHGCALTSVRCCRIATPETGLFDFKVQTEQQQLHTVLQLPA